MSALPYMRSARVSSEVYEILASVIHNELSDPRLKGIQLTSSEMTKDLKILKVYYYVEGGEAERRHARQGLNSAIGYLKRSLSEHLRLRVIPEIKFYFDDSIERAERLDTILDNLKRKRC